MGLERKKYSLPFTPPCLNLYAGCREYLFGAHTTNRFPGTATSRISSHGLHPCYQPVGDPYRVDADDHGRFSDPRTKSGLVDGPVPIGHFNDRSLVESTRL